MTGFAAALSISSWLNITGLLITAICSIGAGWLLRKRKSAEGVKATSSRHLSWEKFFVDLAVVSALVALISLPFSLRESAQLEGQIQKVDPMNVPAREWKAWANFRIEEFVRGTNRNMANPRCAHLFLGRYETNDMANHLLLDADTFEQWDKNCFIEFKADPAFSRRLINMDTNVTVGELLKELDCFRMSIYFLPPGTVVTSGTITLTMNSTIEKTFTIPPQKVRWDSLSNPVNLVPADIPISAVGK